MQTRLDYINLYQCDRGFTTQERVFDFPYLLFVHRGAGVYRIGQTPYAAAMGDLFFCPAGTGNTILADGEDPFLLSGIDFRVTSGPALELPPKMNILANGFLVSLVNRMAREYELGRIHSRDICDSLLSAMLLELLRASRLSPSGRADRELEMLEYLRANTGRTVSLAEVSRAFSYHRSSVNRILLAATGMSLREYQIAARIRKAAELLAYSNRPLGEIAALCGYSSQIFFSRQFRLKTGQTPGEYRRGRQKPI